MTVSTAYSLREVERLLGVSGDTLKRWLRSGRLRGFRLPGQNGAWRIEADEVARIKAAGRRRGVEQMGASRDPAVQRLANMRRRVAALRQHQAARGEDGKSSVARRGGLIGGPARAAQFGDARIWGVAANLRRWHGIDMPRALMDKPQ